MRHVWPKDIPRPTVSELAAVVKKKMREKETGLGLMFALVGISDDNREVGLDFYDGSNCFGRLTPDGRVASIDGDEDDDGINTDNHADRIFNEYRRHYDEIKEFARDLNQAITS